jgi:hypothetical protein
VTEIEFNVDTMRTRLQERFFDTFEFDSREELFAAIGDMNVSLDTIARSLDSRAAVYSGWVYWFLFLKGYLRFSETGEVESDNVYLDYLVRYYGPRNHDPGITVELCRPELARARAAWRFASMQQAASEAVHPGTWATDAVRVVLRDSLATFPLYVYRIGSERPFAAAFVDGWHRLFAARLWEIPSLPGRLASEDEFEVDLESALAGAGE